MKILITGGAGYIGSHTIVELLLKDYDVIVMDNLSNSKFEVLRRIEKITGKKVYFYNKDLLDYSSLRKIFINHKIDAVIHFAGLKAVGESVEKPILYYENNLISTINLIKAMDEFNVKKLIFSSSATVYGIPKKVPIKESSLLNTTNPYGRTKYIIECMLQDLVDTHNNWEITSLRYFNPIGAHKSGLIGEDPSEKPNNILPYLTKVAIGTLPHVNIFGNDYPTVDGTGVRDYVHVIDLALAHIIALEKGLKKNNHQVYNVGTGKGTSVLELIKYLEEVSGNKVKYKITERRNGDIAICYADNSKMLAELKWSPNLGVKEAVEDAWRWQKNNPNGF